MRRSRGRLAAVALALALALGAHCRRDVDLGTDPSSDAAPPPADAGPGG